MTDNLFYIHLQADGNISIAAEGDELKPIPESFLRPILAELAEDGGAVLFSLDSPEYDPDQPPPILAVFDLVRSYGLPLKFMTGGHPGASRPGDPGYFSPLMMTASGGLLEWLEELLRREVDLEARDEHGYTALMYAANEGQVTAAERLMAAGADVNATDNQGSSPLMFAAQHGHAALVTLLLASGANPNSRGDHGFTPLRFAEQNEHTEAAALIRSAGGVV
jgi:uncharacterized protein